ncbi:hypothetical protein N0V94_002144 [Neodidymelliopsis sp. IMI 364377]|nr:hypothetical protein N0V94_002144 [Neodidymelliopsis sp. IMI 364377]
MAPPTILIVGATGNTGRETTRSLSQVLETNQDFSGYRLLAQTRFSNSAAAQQLAKLPHVEVIEYQWSEITPNWLRKQNVVRAFIASHNQPNQFAEESTFLVAALRAGVEYVVRISTTAANVFPTCDAYYPRTHWAIEAMLSSPEFEGLKWSSLQPNVFSTMVVGTAAELVKTYRKEGKQDTLRLILDENTPAGIVHPDDVGNFAARLLSQRDISVHNRARYVLNGPADVTGAQIVKLIEETIGTKVENVVYKDVSFVEYMAAQSKESKNVILSIKYAPETTWAGKATVATTSKEVLELAPPTRTLADTWREALK